MVRLYERKNSPYWYAEFEVAGRTIRVSTHVVAGPKTARNAIEVASREQSRREQNRLRQSYLSFESVAVQFLNSHQGQRNDKNLRPATLNNYRKSLVSVVKELGAEPIIEITVPRLKSYIHARKGHTTDLQIRAELTAIWSVVEWAIDQDIEGAPETNPARLVHKKGLAKPVSHSRPIDVETLRSIFRVVAGHGFWEPFLTLLLETGMRHQEALGLEWTEVDLMRGCILLNSRRVKTKQGRVVVLSDLALRTLSAQPRYVGSPHVFTSARTGHRYHSIWNGWGKIRQKANCSSIRIHDFRHTFASYTRRLGMDRLDRKDIMGHTTEESHELYSATDVATLRGVMNKFSPSTLLAQLRDL